MTHLYELSQQMIGLQAMIEDDELDSTALADTLDGLKGDISIKAENLLGYVANLASDVDAIDTEIKRLAGRKKVISNRQGRLKDYLRDNMISAEIDKITCPLFSITLRKAPMVAVVDAHAPDLPEKYQRTTVSANKALIKTDLQAGVDIAGCRLMPGQRGLLIR